MFLTSTVKGSGARACVRAQGGGGSRSPKLETAQLRLRKISQLFKKFAANISSDLGHDGIVSYLETFCY